MDVLTLNSFSHYLKPRPRDCHKNDFGHVVIIGGNVGYAGAVQLTAEAALRVGAGRVSVITHPEHAHALTTYRPEIMYPPLKKIKNILETSTVLVIGPGLGQDTWAKK